jgi:hypothetical protein
MRMKRGIVLLVGLAIVLAGPALAGKPAGAQKSALTVKGMVMSWESGKTLKIRDRAGKDVTFEIDAATHLKGTPAAGEMIVVQYRIQDSKNLATAVLPWAPGAATDKKTAESKPPARPAPKPVSATPAPQQQEKK